MSGFMPRAGRPPPEGVPDAHPTALAGGLRVFAGILMLADGLLQVLQGIAAVADDDFFNVPSGFTYDLNVTAWGWVHIVLGLLLALIGYGVLANSTLGRAVAIPVVVIGMVSNFAFLPVYPLWAIVLIVLDVFVLWALVTAPEF
jgi:hypothetical protein